MPLHRGNLFTSSHAIIFTGHQAKRYRMSPALLFLLYTGDKYPLSAEDFFSEVEETYFSLFPCLILSQETWKNLLYSSALILSPVYMG